jgi:hypothetical protein
VGPGCVEVEEGGAPSPASAAAHQATWSAGSRVVSGSRSSRSAGASSQRGRRLRLNMNLDRLGERADLRAQTAQLASQLSSAASAYRASRRRPGWVPRPATRRRLHRRPSVNWVSSIGGSGLPRGTDAGVRRPPAEGDGPRASARARLAPRPHRRYLARRPTERHDPGSRGAEPPSESVATGVYANPCRRGPAARLSCRADRRGLDADRVFRARR